jgi:hypothetical protein
MFPAPVVAALQLQRCGSAAIVLHSFRVAHGDLVRNDLVSNDPVGNGPERRRAVRVQVPPGGPGWR